MKMSYWTFVLAGLIPGLLTGCGKAPSEPAKQTGEKALSVFVVNYPLQYFAERIGGDLIDVQFPAPGDEDPAYWSPDTSAVAAYQKADLILLNGADYAKWVSKVSLPAAKVVDTGKALADQFIQLDEHITHSHGPGGEHAHGGFAFTTWLEPPLAVEQARAVQDALARKLPDDQAQLQRRLTALVADLLAIDRQIKDVVAANQEQPLVFSHPVYQYFERRYALNGKSVHWEPDQEPDEKMWEELKKMLATHPAKWMVWEGNPTPETIAKLEELGLGTVVFDPCGNAPAEGDYLSIMRENVQQLSKAFEPGE